MDTLKLQINGQVKEKPILTEITDFFGNTETGAWVKIANAYIPMETIEKHLSTHTPEIYDGDAVLREVLR